MGQVLNLYENNNSRPDPEFQFCRRNEVKDLHQRNEEKIIISETKKRAAEKIRAVWITVN
ncbi:hypothetical protein DO021_02570 [Desulfobacter hydrogenophilus]|uniref:Uncharacterized protein n=1 Tax=Desulfobacter hydrogenophilus TaxID=2291 RepID=A0A328FIG5_9BACT|nr:hypothetical protein DO021_02570 [Desulfobacter hydrogenophilus]